MKSLAIFALWFAAATAFAQYGRHFHTGNDLEERLQSHDSFQQGTAIGFVTGVADALQVDTSSQVCISTEATIGQIQKIVEKYLDAHPEKLDLPAAFLVKSALIEAFYCK